MQVLYKGQVTDLSAAIHSALASRYGTDRNHSYFCKPNAWGEVVSSGHFGYMLASIGFTPCSGPWRYLNPLAQDGWSALLEALKAALTAAYTSPEGYVSFAEPRPLASADLEILDRIIAVSAFRQQYRPIRPIYVIDGGQRTLLSQAAFEALNSHWHEVRGIFSHKALEQGGEPPSDQDVWAAVLSQQDWMPVALGSFIFKLGSEFQSIRIPSSALVDCVMGEVMRVGTATPPYDYSALDEVQFDARVAPILEQERWVTIDSLMTPANNSGEA